MEAWNPNIQTVINKFGPFCVRNVGTRQRDRMTEKTSAEQPPSLPASSEASVRVRTKAVSAAVNPKGENVHSETNQIHVADAAPEEQPPPLTEQTSAEQPPSTPARSEASVCAPKAVLAAEDPLPKDVSAAVDPKEENVPGQTIPSA
jgi:hypothetical protein